MRPKRKLRALTALAVATASLFAATPAFAAEPIDFPPGYDGVADTLCQHDAVTNTVSCEPLEYAQWDNEFVAPTPEDTYPSNQSVNGEWGESRAESPATVVPLNTVNSGSDFAVEPSVTLSLSRDYTLGASFFDNSSAAPVDAVRIVGFYGTVISPEDWNAQSTTPWDDPYAGTDGELVQTIPTGRSFPVVAIDGSASDFTGGLISKTLEFTVPTPTMVLRSDAGIHAVAYMVKLTAVTETTYNGTTRTSSVSGLFSSSSDTRSDINTLMEEDCDQVGDSDMCSETSGLSFDWQSVSLAAVLENSDPVEPPVITPVDPPVVVEPPVEVPVADEPPVEVPPLVEVPVEDVPVVDVPVQEVPVVDIPVVDVPVDEVPVVDPPVVDVPIQDVPVEEAPTAVAPKETLAYTGSEAVSGIVFAALILLALGTGLSLLGARRSAKNVLIN